MLLTRSIEHSWRYDHAFPLYARLPWRTAYRLAAWQSNYFYQKQAQTRERIRSHMQEVFPSASAEQIDVWARDYFRMVEQEALDTWFLDQPVIPEIVQLTGFELVQAARASGQKVLLSSGHFGRFWMAGPAMRQAGASIGTITRDGGATNQHGLHPAEYRYRLWKLKRLQSVLAGPFLVEGEDLRPLYKELSKHLITLLFDVSYSEIPRGSVTVPFLNGTISVPAGIYKIAKKTKAVVAPFYMHDSGSGAVVAEFSQLLDPDNYNDEEFMSLLATQLESRIRARPGQWWLWEALPLLRRQ
ncbi:MAG: lipid A biosynthesis acyltransferase [Thiothrix sp.]|nr:MAG: lipid A biosynthesis acyltransferase [Thiothrix sp.]